jgi:hypothetical protein
MHLASVGAPPEMIVASQRASLDEVRHARACSTLARRYGGRTMGPAASSLAGAMAPLTLAEIAALTAEEGCVGETLGALLAEEQIERTTDSFGRLTCREAHAVASRGIREIVEPCAAILLGAGARCASTAPTPVSTSSAPRAASGVI